MYRDLMWRNRGVKEALIAIGILIRDTIELDRDEYLNVLSLLMSQRKELEENFRKINMIPIKEQRDE